MSTDAKWQNRGGYYKDLQEYLATLERAGKLIRVTERINKDTELHPLVRLQFRGLPEEARKAFLFENIYDANGNEYDMPLALCAMAGSTDIYALGLKCEPDDIADLWAYAQGNPIAPVEVATGPVKEVVIKGKELETGGALTRLPIPISTPGFDNAPYTSASHWISKDPDTGLHNVGNYRGMLKSNTRIGVFPASPGFGLRRHIEMWRKQGLRQMPAAIVIGVPPAISYTAVTRLPNDVCEYDVAGGLAGQPMELVRGETVDLLVPAQAQIVVEGFITTDEQEMEGPFGEFPGYMAARGHSWFLDVTCITMRKKPIYTAFISQLPPSESSKIRYAGWTGVIRRTLKDAGFKNVLDVHLPEASGSFGVLLIKIRKQKEDDGQRILEIVRNKFVGKVAIVLPEDIDIRDPDAVYWALSFNFQPHRDARIDDINLMPLDPSVSPPGTNRGLNDIEKPRSTGLLIDATRDWAYPPTSLPKKEYMENAIRIWKRLGLPELKLKNPWYGYDLGYWSDEEADEAAAAVAGKYFETGEKHAKNRRTLDPDADY